MKVFLNYKKKYFCKFLYTLHLCFCFNLSSCLLQEITGRDNCRRDRACFSAPPTCNPGAQGSCYFLSTKGTTENADNFIFELSGESDGYIAAGLSRDSSVRDLGLFHHIFLLMKQTNIEAL